MAAACLRSNLEQRKSADFLQSLKRKRTCLARLPVVDSRHDIAGGVFDQSVVQFAGTHRDSSLNERQIPLLDAVNAELFRQPTCPFAGSSKQNDARDRSVQPMDNSDENVSRLLILLPQVLPGGIHQSRLARVVTHRQQARGFVESQAMIVFVKNNGKSAHEMRRTLKIRRLGQAISQSYKDARRKTKNSLHGRS